MDTMEAEKVDARQLEPSVEEVVQGSTVAGASQATRSPSQVGNKGRVARKMGSIHKCIGYSKVRGGEESEGAAQETED